MSLCWFRSLGEPGFLIKSLSDHYNAPGRLAGYKRQFQRACRRPGDDPSIFAIELETLARRAFIDIDTSIQLLMVRDRFINGQAECALRRHLDSLGPTTPMADIVEEDTASPDTSVDSAEGCFSCGELTHMTDQCRTLDESFPFLPTGWQAEHIGDQFILGPGPTTRPQSQQMGNTD